MPTINPCGDPPTGYACPTCGIWVFPGAVHYCGALPNPFPGAQPTPGCRAPCVPLTADAVRLIVRDMRQGIREVRLGAAMESRLLLARVRIGVRARGAEFGARCARGCRIRRPRK